jgi:hypothetical protein
MILDTQLVGGGLQQAQQGAPVDVMITQASNSFLSSLGARIIGTLIGNLFAGVCFTWVARLWSNSDSRAAEKDFQQQTITPSASDFFKLALCVAIDLVGDSSFLIPGFGEAEDIVWAPISSFLLYTIFGSTGIAALDFTKEILPFSDLMPVATIAWLLQNYYSGAPITGFLGLHKSGQFGHDDHDNLEKKR